MSATYGYNFYFSDGGDVLTFPITPGKLTIKVGSNNKVVTLISEGDINILKSPSLTEIEFEARFPMRKYPYSREYSAFQNYFDKFKDLKENKKPFRFIVAREMMKGGRTWDTNILVALEEFEINEDADEGDDVLITFNLKQYKEYGVKQLPASSARTTTSTSNVPRSTANNPSSSSSNYTVKSGDCLYNIAKKTYNDSSYWQSIYDLNKEVIEKTANLYGKKSSSNGHWIYPGTSLKLPAKSSPTVKKAKGSGSASSRIGNKTTVSLN